MAECDWLILSTFICPITEGCVNLCNQFMVCCFLPAPPKSFVDWICWIWFMQCMHTDNLVRLIVFNRNLEADVAFRSTAAVFSYCRSRGLYVGVSLVGSYLVERKETNRKYVLLSFYYQLHISFVFAIRLFTLLQNVLHLWSWRFYSQDIRASAILNGDVDPPPEAYDLYAILEHYTEKYTSDWQSKYMNPNKKVSVPSTNILHKGFLDSKGIINSN